MSIHTGILPLRAGAENARPVKQLVFTICYLAAISVAMVGWLSALGLATVAAAERLFF